MPRFLLVRGARALLFLLGFVAAGRSAAAQGADSLVQRPPRVEAGLGSGTLGLGDGRTATGLILQATWHLRPTIDLSLSPTLERLSAQAAGRATAPSTAPAATPVSGLADLPFAVNTQHTWNARAWTPSILAAIDGMIPTGSQANGLGVGRTVANLLVGTGVQPLEHLGVNVSAMREVTREPDAGVRPLGLQADVNTSLGEAFALDVGWSRDVALLHGAEPYRSVSVGASWQLRPSLALAVDWSRSTVGSASTGPVLQGVSVGIGMVVPSFVPTNGDPAALRGRSGANGRQRVAKAAGKNRRSRRPTTWQAAG